MDISILSGTANSCRVGDVGNIPEDDAGPAVGLTLQTRSHADGDEVWESSVNVDIVGATPSGWVGMAGQIACCGVGSVECNWACWINVEKFLHVEDLDTVVFQFT